MATKRSFKDDQDDLMWLFEDCLDVPIPDSMKHDDEKAIKMLMAQGIYFSVYNFIYLGEIKTILDSCPFISEN